LSKLLKTLERTVVLEAWTNRIGMQALREIEEAYRRMLQEMVDYAVKHKASQATLHEVFYQRFREEYPWLPTRIVKGCYRDAVRIAKSFRSVKTRQYTREIVGEIIEFMDLDPKRDWRLIKRSQKTIYKVARSIALHQLELEIAEGLKPTVKKITIHYSDAQDWTLDDGLIKIKTHRGWVKLHYRSNKHLHKYLYGGWRLSSELKLKVVGRRILLYLVFEKSVEVGYNPDNVVAVDVNENNVALAVFIDGKLKEFIRIETNLGKIVIAYSERRRKITKGKSTKDRSSKKALRRLREYDRKRDVVYKTSRIIENVARMYNARVVVGDVYINKDDILERIVDDKLRHRIHQWSVSSLVKVLNQKPLYLETIAEEGTSSRDPFRKRRKLMYASAVIRFVKVSGGFRRRVKVGKVILRTARLSNGWILDRDMVGSLNIGLKALASDGRCVAFTSTEPHAVRAKHVNPHQGLTQTTELKYLEISRSVGSGKRCCRDVYTTGEAIQDR